VQRRFLVRRLIDLLLPLIVVIGCSSQPALLVQERPRLPSAEARGANPAAAPEVLRLTRNQPGDSKPILIDADEIFTWNDNGTGQFVALLKGQVLVQQNVLQARFQQGVAFIDMKAYKQSGILRMVLYAEGQVRLDSGTETKEAGQALLDVSTRGELKLHTHQNKVVQQSRAEDPLVKRALAVRAAPAPPAPPPQPKAPEGPAPSGVQRTMYEERTPVLPAQGPPRPPDPGPPAPPSPPPQPPDVPPPSSPAPADAGAGELPPPTPVPPPVPQAARDGPPRQFSIFPRQGTTFNAEIVPDPVGGEKAIVITGGAIISVRNAPNVGMLDILADRVVVWTKGDDPERLLTNLQTAEGQTSNALEFYLSGNVVIRTASTNGQEAQTLRADEVYYDVNRNVAVAVTASLELKQLLAKQGIPPDPIILRADELLKTSPTTYEMTHTEIFSSKLPSDPGLKVYVNQVSIEEKTVPKLSIFGRRVINRATGREEQEQQTIVHGTNVFLELENIPVLYFPYLSGDLRDPLGPIEDVSFGYSRIFGFQFGVGLNAYDLLGIQPYQDTRWRLNLDYLTNRGPVVGTSFDYKGKILFGIPAKYEGLVIGNAMSDRNFDDIGSDRPVNNFTPTDFRGRLLWREQAWEMPYGFSVQTQLAALSDRNYLEQYFKNEFDAGLPYNTYAYVKQQQGSWAWTGLVEPRIRDWVTETEAVPRLDGYLLGYSLFNLFTSSTHVEGGYYQLLTSSDPLPPVSPTDQTTRTGRFSVEEELSLPFQVGPFKVVPYVKGLLAEYTQDLNGDEIGRAWGGFGLRGSIPFTRLYPDVESELFNLNGINHKIVASANYFYAGSNEPYTRFPQLDRLNDDPTDQSLRELRPQLPMLNPAHGAFLAQSPLFDPQVYAIRRVLDNYIDTLNAVEVLQMDVRQRLQTKRGYPGVEHIVDWMTLDLSATYFPAPQTYNFGSHWAFLEYNYVWNLGDRVAIESTGWVDPFSVAATSTPAPNGTPSGPAARVFTVGAFFNRPDRTSFYLGFRQIEPVGSQAITGSVTYVFSPKYAMTASSTYDFGTNQALTSSLVFTRVGTDLQVSFGISYNALTDNFGVLFEIVPNLLPPNRRLGPVGALGNGGLLSH
jgi:hypothetical protein